jgi:tetratricopeptide (TPR) repeat protein
MTAPTIQELAAQAFARVALTDLRVSPAPTAEDYRIALALLRQAVALQPNDAEFVRLAIDASEPAGDAEATQELLRALVALDPSDTVAQLSLISTRISTMQDLAARSAAYSSFLGERGKSLDPSVRSRLALDAALLHRERGDSEAFITRLTQATQLDPTNKDAAALAYAFYSDRVQDDAGRLELLINLLMADPLDRQTHMAIARLLASVGAAKQADRFYANTMSLEDSDGGLTLEVSTERSVVLWALSGATAAVAEMNKTIRDTRRDLASVRRQITDAKGSLEGIPDPDTVRLDVDSERTRLLAAAAAEDRETASASAIDLIKSVDALDGFIADPKTLPRRMTKERAESLREVWRVDLPLMLLIAGENIDEAKKRIDKLAEASAPPLPAATRTLLDGWLKVRTGDLDGAAVAFNSLSASEALAQLGLGVISKLKNDLPGATERWSGVWRGAAGSYVGALARSWAQSSGGKPVPPSAVGERLEAMASGVPAWVDLMLTNPRSFMGLTADVTSPSAGALDAARINIRIRNLTPAPIRLAPEGPISSRFLLAPSVQIGSAGERGVPEVINADRRLRIMPREDITMSVWADPGYGGWLVENLTGESVRLRWRLLQDFQLAGGVMTHGPHALAIEAGQLTRPTLSLLNATVPELISAIGDDAGPAFAHAVAAVQVRLRTVGAEGGMRAAEADEIIKALLARYQREGPTVRAFLLLRIPNITATVAFATGVKAIADSDAGVVMAKIVTRCSDASDPWLKALSEGTTASPVANVARLHAQRLRAGAKCFATLSGVRVDLPVDAPAPAK